MAAFGCECGSDGPGLSRLQAEIAVDPIEVSFGQVPLGATAVQELQIENKGTDRLRVCLADTTVAECTGEKTHYNPAGAPFADDLRDGADRDNGGAWILDKASERVVQLKFTPQAAGGASAELVLVHTAVNGPTTTIKLGGEGVEPRVDFSAETIDFGEVTVGQRKVLDLVLTNGTQFAQPVSIAPLTQASVVFGTNDGNVDTAPGATYQGTVPGNGSLVIKVFFQPQDEGPAMNSLTVAYCPTCSRTVGLSGVGVKPQFVLEPAMLDFGTLNEGQLDTKSFVVRNTGNVRLSVDGVALQQGTTTEYTVTPQTALPASLGPGETLTVSVAYQGTSPGRDAGRVEVGTNAWDDPATGANDAIGIVELHAISTGADIEAIPPMVSFGTVAINGAAVGRMVIIQNAGNAPLTVSNVQLNAPSAEITLAAPPALPQVLQGGGSISLSLSYAPTNAGLDEAQLVVTSDDRDEGTLVVPVSGVGGVPTTCSIMVGPSQVTFGLVERGRRATLPVEIRNSGAQPCTVTNIALNGGAEFVVRSGAAANVNIPMGGVHRVEIDYSPTAYGMHTTTLNFGADDPAQPSVSVPITGSSAPTDLLVTPSSLDFNVVPVTCRSPNRAITLYNTGSSNITISQVYLDASTSTEFELQPFTTPTTLTAGGSSVITVRYHPRDIGADSGVLFIVHSSAPAPVAVPLAGEGALNPTVTDTFTQQPTPQADVLFVVDNSGSMDAEQASLGANLSAFLTFAQQQSIDYQIGITTTDVDFGGEQGRFVGNVGDRIMRPTTPNVNNVFSSRVTGLGTFGSSLEQGLEAAYLALSDPNINGHNAGFLRVDAALAVIVVSDEEDSSPRQVSFYENFFRNIKGFQNASLFSFSAIVGISPGGCSGPGGSADYGSRYVQVAQNTGGVVESICNANWGQTLANIGLNTFGLRRAFQLSSQPVPVTIAVTVNGASVPSTTAGGQQNWSYDQNSNSVIFTANATPQANSTVTITYTVACLP